jgi:hypothetical protein
MECLAHHCAVVGSDPVPETSKRYVLDPATVALVGASRPSAAAGLPPAATLGGKAEGAASLYLDFEPSWPPAARVDRAFLLLSPVFESPPSSRDVRITAWRVAEPWSAAEVTFLAQPELEPPRAVGIARSAPPQKLRLDVTRIVQHWQQHPHDRRGLAVVADAGTGHGVAYATGAGSHPGPRLEVYVLEEQPE